MSTPIVRRPGMVVTICADAKRSRATSLQGLPRRAARTEGAAARRGGTAPPRSRWSRPRAWRAAMGIAAWQADHAAARDQVDRDRRRRVAGALAGPFHHQRSDPAGIAPLLRAVTAHLRREHAVLGRQHPDPGDRPAAAYRPGLQGA